MFGKNKAKKAKAIEAENLVKNPNSEDKKVLENGPGNPELKEGKAADNSIEELEKHLEDKPSNENFGDEELKETPVLENAPPLELSKEDKIAILQKQDEKFNEAEKLSTETKTYENGYNEWKVINSARNDVMGYSFKTLAMKIGTRGVMICVIEASGNKSSMSTEFISQGKLEKSEDGNWLVK